MQTLETSVELFGRGLQVIAVSNADAARNAQRLDLGEHLAEAIVGPRNLQSLAQPLTQQAEK